MANNGDVKIGKVVQIIGPVVDVEFENYLPPIHQALRIVSDGFDVEARVDVVAEVQQHLGEGRVRAIAMDSTDGVQRGTAVRSTGKPIAMPVGQEVRGRLFNVVGQATDGLPQPKAEDYRPIHAPPPPFEELAASV